MGMTADAYLRQLQALLPEGAAWPREADADITKALYAIAEEFARIDQRAVDLLEEADPETTQELLPEWEEDAGLPDLCTGPLPTIQERRSALLARLHTDGGQSPMFFVSLAAEMGYEIIITEFRPFTAGSRAGGALSNGDWRYTFQINTQADMAIWLFRAGLGRAGEPLKSGENTLLECVIGRLKPAHTIVIFAYS